MELASFVGVLAVLLLIVINGFKERGLAAAGLWLVRCAGSQSATGAGVQDRRPHR